MINNKELKYIVPGWIVLMLLNYYIDFFFFGLEFLFLLTALFIIAILQFIRLIKERKTISAKRIRKVTVYTKLFLLTLFSWIPNRIIEKADWRIFYGNRKNIVKQVESGELKPNAADGLVCKLTYSFPPVSNGGNDIIIRRNKDNDGISIQFFISRNFFDVPSPQFIYTTDKMRIAEFEKNIKKDPDNNWKVEEGWYRIYGH